jgi:hypothetical protein
LWLLHLQQARASGDKKQQNQKLNLVHQCILLQRTNLQQLNKNISSSARNAKLAQLEEK